MERCNTEEEDRRRRKKCKKGRKEGRKIKRAKRSVYEVKNASSGKQKKLDAHRIFADLSDADFLGEFAGTREERRMGMADAIPTGPPSTTETAMPQKRQNQALVKLTSSKSQSGYLAGCLYGIPVIRPRSQASMTGRLLSEMSSGALN